MRSTSLSGGEHTPLAIGRVGEAGADVAFGDLWEVGPDLVVRHAGGEPAEDVGDGDPQAANAGSAAALAGLDGDDLAVVGHATA